MKTLLPAIFICLLSSPALCLEESEFHCWYSSKQLDVRDRYNMPLLYAMVNGKRVMYTEMTKKDGKPNSWDDSIYLGICIPEGWWQKTKHKPGEIKTP